VVEINDTQVPTTKKKNKKKGLETGFQRVKFENPTPQEVQYSTMTFYKTQDATMGFFPFLWFCLQAQLILLPTTASI
jgi:hypothetical protein